MNVMTGLYSIKKRRCLRTKDFNLPRGWLILTGIQLCASVALLLQTRCSTFIVPFLPCSQPAEGLPVVPVILNPVGWEFDHSTCSPLSNLGISEQPTLGP